MASTAIHTTAMLDLAGQRAVFRYFTHSLGVVLHQAQNLYRGATISRVMTTESITVRESYVSKAKEHDTLAVNASFGCGRKGRKVGEVGGR